MNTHEARALPYPVATTGRYLLIDADEFLRASTAFTMYALGGGEVQLDEKSKPQLKAHQRAIKVLGPKRGRWK